MGEDKIKIFPKKYTYSPEVEQYCKIECPRVKKKPNGKAYCYGKWVVNDGIAHSDGLECDRVINFCLNHECDF